AEHGIGHLTAGLVDHHSFDGADLVAARAVDRSSLHLVAADEVAGLPAIEIAGAQSIVGSRVHGKSPLLFARGVNGPDSRGFRRGSIRSVPVAPVPRPCPRAAHPRLRGPDRAARPWGRDSASPETDDADRAWCG